jgi:hypothetical protein
VHTLGFVPTCAPHFTAAGHTSDSPTDLMYAGSEAWHPSVLDIGRDDYFNAHIPGCADLASSRYLDGNEPFTLTVAVVATGGQGTATSEPAGIDCPTTCAAGFDRSSTVTLSAHPAAGSRFAGWSGVCADSAPTCRVTMDAAKSVSATFAASNQTATPPQTATPQTATSKARMLLHSAVVGSRLVKAGHKVGFAIRWQNSGGTRATRLVVCAQLPKQMVIVTARGAASSARKACWRRSSVAPNARLSFTFVARVSKHPTVASATIVTTATATNAAQIRARVSVRLRG